MVGHRISLEVRVVMSVIVMVSQLQSSLSRKAFVSKFSARAAATKSKVSHGVTK